jgi:peptidoglycan hydrolase-like protein with peptidoglycan-binding domain
MKKKVPSPKNILSSLTLHVLGIAIAGALVLSFISHQPGTQVRATNHSITSVTTTAADGTYGEGASIPITATMSEPLGITSQLVVDLNSGGVVAFAPFVEYLGSYDGGESKDIGLTDSAYVYSANEAGQEIEVINISNPGAPTEDAQINAGGYASFLDFDRGTKRLSVAEEGTGKLSVYDTSSSYTTPLSLRMTTRAVVHTTEMSVTANPNVTVILDSVSGDYELYNYVDDAAVSISVVDGTVNDIVINNSGDELYIGSSAGFLFYDFPGNADPTLLSTTVVAGGSVVGVAVENNYAYVVSSSRLEVIDFTDPGNPILSAVSYDLVDGRDVVVEGEYAVVADGLSGIKIYDISTPMQPVLYQAVPSSGGTALRVDMYNGRIVVADDDLGISIYGAQTWNGQYVVGSGEFTNGTTGDLTVSSVNMGITYQFSGGVEFSALSLPMGSNLGDNSAIEIQTSGIPVIEVTTDADNITDGGAADCTLREAIHNANDGGVTYSDCAGGGNAIDRIEFAIAGPDHHTITPTSALPSITGSLDLDASNIGTVTSCGTTQDLDNRQIRITLDGSGAGAGVDGLTIEAGAVASVIRGFAITNFSDDGIEVYAQDVTVSCNHIGVDNTGDVAAPNGVNGIYVYDGATDIIIGGSSVSDRNIISANPGEGIDIEADGAIILGNYIGTNRLGDTALGTILPDGIRISSTADNALIGGSLGTTPGGACTGSCNLISGNNKGVVYIGSNLSMYGNYLGVDASGMSAVPNDKDGLIASTGAADALVGDGTPEGRNIFSGNLRFGFTFQGDTGNVTLQGNYFGVGSDGATPVPNERTGISLYHNASGTNLVGGVNAGEGNIIAYNGVNPGVLNRNGIVLGLASTTSILGNSIFSNEELGIEIGDNGLNDIDIGDLDTGTNDLLNFPMIVTAEVDNGTVTVGYMLDVTPAGVYRMELFSNPSGVDTTGYGEGEVFVGSATISHAGSGAESFSGAYTGGSAGDVVTMTATYDPSGNGSGYGATSEFSQSFTVTAAPVSPIGSSHSGQLRRDVTGIFGPAPEPFNPPASQIDGLELLLLLFGGDSSGTLACMPNARPSLYRGDKDFFGGTQPVVELQRALAANGFDPGIIDGSFGRRTLDAVRTLQIVHTLKIDGVAGPQVYGVLFGTCLNKAAIAPQVSTHTLNCSVYQRKLSRGDTDGVDGLASVLKLQQALHDAGFTLEKIDGKFGAMTERTVRDFQEAKSLKVDGIAGGQVFGALFLDCTPL